MKVIQVVVPIVFDDLYYLLSRSKKELCSYTNNSVRLVSAFMRLLLSQVNVHSSPIITIDNSTQHRRNPLFQLNTSTIDASSSSITGVGNYGHAYHHSTAASRTNDERVSLRQYVTEWVLYTVLPVLRVHVQTVNELMLVVYDLLCMVQSEIVDSGCRYAVGMTILLVECSTTSSR